jgi:hypothetical protein
MIFTHMRACTDLLPHRTRDTIETIVDRNVLRSGAGLYADGARVMLPLCDERLERLQQAPAGTGRDGVVAILHLSGPPRQAEILG